MSVTTLPQFSLAHACGAAGEVSSSLRNLGGADGLAIRWVERQVIWAIDGALSRRDTPLSCWLVGVSHACQVASQASLKDADGAAGDSDCACWFGPSAASASA